MTAQWLTATMPARLASFEVPIATRREGECALETRQLSVYYGTFRAVKNVSLRIQRQKITALIGPSGCGKSTFLRALNRMNDLIPGSRTEGEVI